MAASTFHQLLFLIVLTSAIFRIQSKDSFDGKTFTVNTTERYNILLTNQVDESYYTIAVTAGGHETPMSLPKSFQHAIYPIMRFSDDVGNKVAIYPNIKYVIGFFECGERLTLGMPDTYLNYYVRFRSTAIATSADIDNVLQWTQAKQLVLLDEGDLALQLSKRTKEMKAMKDLTELTISIHTSLRVDTFLRHIPKLQLLTLSVDALRKHGVDDFLKMQRFPRGWQTEMDEVNKMIRLTRR